MSTIQFLAEWGFRSSVLILAGALLLWALRVKDPSIRLAAWAAMLCGSLAMPLFTAVAPGLPLLPVTRAALKPVAAPAVTYAPASEPVREASPQSAIVSKPFDWPLAALIAYALTAAALLLRLCVGLAISRRLLRASRATGRATEGIEIRESDGIVSPVALGVVRPAIVLPADWREWDAAKLDAVLAHERSHIRRHDPATQLLSAIHRALLWYSPMSWFLHLRIVRVAEEASDDAAVAVTRNRPLYAEVVLSFLQRGLGDASWQGVPMARYGRADRRIQRILDGATLSRGVTRWSVAAILALGAPLAYLAAAANPRSEPQTPAVPAPAQAASVPAPAVKPSGQTSRQPAPAYWSALGYVAASTVTVKPRVDGQLMSVSFTEGGVVQAGQVLASLDPRPYQVQLVKAEGQLAQTQAQLANAATQLQRLSQLRAQNAIPQDQVDPQAAAVKQLEASIRIDQANVENAKLQLSYAQVTAPISGVAGLRLVDPGNIVHATDETGIVTINQLQPISVLFTIPEDSLPQVLARLREGATPPVEAWNRDNSARIATGRLTGVDNQIDQQTGTAKLKAVFDNKDGALFPNEFVNVRLFMK